MFGVKGIKIIILYILILNFFSGFYLYVIVGRVCIFIELEINMGFIFISCFCDLILKINLNLVLELVSNILIEKLLFVYDYYFMVI